MGQEAGDGEQLRHAAAVEPKARLGVERRRGVARVVVQPPLVHLQQVEGDVPPRALPELGAGGEMAAHLLRGEARSQLEIDGQGVFAHEGQSRVEGLARDGVHVCLPRLA